MAISKRSTKKTCRTARKTSRRNKNTRDRKAALKVAEFLYSLTSRIVPVPPFGDPALEILTRSQRMRLADLAAETGYSTKTWVRRAVKNFLSDEAPVFFMKAREFNARRAA